MNDGIKINIDGKSTFLKNFSNSAIKEATKVAVRDNVKSFQKTMQDVTPVGNAFDGDKHSGRLKEAWVKPVNSLPTFRITTPKSGNINLFLYNHAQDEQGREYAKFVNNGHESFNQYGGPYVTHNGTTKVRGRFFIEKGLNKIENDSQLSEQIGKSLERRLNSVK